jgi:hypothetical protein
MKVKLFFLCVGAALVVLVLLPTFAERSNPLPPDLQEQMLRSSSFEVLALNHDPQWALGATNAGTNMLLNYVILGSVMITNRDLRHELVDDVSDDILKANHGHSTCILEPRHGIRCIDGTNSILMAICYHCGDVVVRRNGKDDGYLIKEDGQSPISKEIFKKIFQEAGVKEDAN